VFLLPESTALTWDLVRQLATSLPGTEEESSYGTPALKINGKLFARLHQDGENIVLRTDKKARRALIQSNPDAFHLTPHYMPAPYVLAGRT
jgi:hypothetical protein